MAILSLRVGVTPKHMLLSTDTHGKEVTLHSPDVPAKNGFDNIININL